MPGHALKSCYTWKHLDHLLRLRRSGIPVAVVNTRNICHTWKTWNICFTWEDQEYQLHLEHLEYLLRLGARGIYSTPGKIRISATSETPGISAASKNAWNICYAW